MTEPAGIECTNCGHTLHPDSAYCGVCGTPVRDREEPIGVSDDPWGDQVIAEDDEAAYQSELDGDVLADMGTRTGAFALNAFVPGFLGFIPFLGIVISIGWSIANLIFYQRGQDVGARLLKIRVMRSNGDVAGFYHMWTRNLASGISAFVFLAGYWTAYLDSENRTWHDKMLDTYVIRDNEFAATRPGTSSSAAKAWFWGSLIFFAAMVVLIVVLLVAVASSFD